MYKLYPFSKKSPFFPSGAEKHLVCVALYILYESTIVLAIGTGAKVIDFIPYYLLAIALFYYTTWITKTRRFPEHIWCLVLFLSIGLTAYCLAYFGLYARFFHLDFNDKRVSGKEGWATAIWRGSLFIIYGVFYRIAQNSVDNAKKRGALQLQQKELENALLRTQINSHFLKNCLHLGYNMVDDKVPEAAELLKRISYYVDYCYFDPADLQQLGMITDELIQIDSYLDINAERFGDSYYLLYDKQVPADTNAQIPPLLLISFIENIFIHGIVTDPAFPASIHISFSANTLTFQTSNAKRKGKPIKSRHVGLRNSISRLEGHYPGRFNLSIQDDESFFTLNLTIQL